MGSCPRSCAVSAAAHVDATATAAVVGPLVVAGSAPVFISGKDDLVKYLPGTNYVDQVETDMMKSR